MSTLSSPRPSITSARSPSSVSSRRPSFDNNLTANSTPAPTQRATSPSLTHQRKNRAALRDYYNLRPQHTDSSSSNQSRSRSIPGHLEDAQNSTPQSSEHTNIELDSPNFDPASYVARLLSTSSLSTILKAENSLISDIRTLDGERKALVYDNYSKLIKAVETISKMRASIEDRGEPMIMTKTLGPAIGFVAEAATTLIREQEQISSGDGHHVNRDAEAKKETVTFVLQTPERLRRLVDDGKLEDAENDWKEISGLLQKWAGVKGVDELRSNCESILAKKS